jgi:hypothetical protein
MFDKRRLTTPLALLLALLLAPLLEVHAGATGGAPWKGFDLPTPVGTYPIPAGELIGSIDGSGLVVTWVRGAFHTLSGSINNWHHSVQFYDLNNRLYKVIDQARQPATSTRGNFAWVPPSGVFRAKPGKACIRLYTHHTQQVASVWHAVHE